MKLSKTIFVGILFLLASCVPLQPLETPEAISTISVSEVHDLLPERKKAFENTLEIHIEINEIIQPDLSLNQPDKVYNPYKIALIAYFKNISEAPLVIRKPQTMDFQGTLGGGDFWDLAFWVESLDGKDIFPYLNAPNLLDPEKVSPTDFLVLEPDGIYSIEFQSDIPYYTYENEEPYGRLLPGSYSLIVIYENYIFGYQLPMTVTPPPNSSFETLSEAAEWQWAHTMQVDLNAWVGMIVSQEVEFTIPNE